MPWRSRTIHFRIEVSNSWRSRARGSAGTTAAIEAAMPTQMPIRIKRSPSGQLMLMPDAVLLVRQKPPPERRHSCRRLDRRLSGADYWIGGAGGTVVPPVPLKPFKNPSIPTQELLQDERPCSQVIDGEHETLPSHRAPCSNFFPLILIFSESWAISNSHTRLRA